MSNIKIIKSHSYTVISCLLFRYVLITWGMITLFCGAYIFGQSTSIAVMQLLNEL